MWQVCGGFALNDSKISSLVGGFKCLYCFSTILGMIGLNYHLVI